MTTIQSKLNQVYTLLKEIEELLPGEPDDNNSLEALEKMLDDTYCARNNETQCRWAHKRQEFLDGLQDVVDEYGLERVEKAVKHYSKHKIVNATTSMPMNIWSPKGLASCMRWIENDMKYEKRKE